MSYRGCISIQRSDLTVNGHIDTEEPVISLCCEGFSNIPKISFKETAEDTLRAFVGECALVSAECAHSPEDSQRYFTAGCVRCHNFREGDYPTDGFIHYVNLSMYPSPCQSRCMYCWIHRTDQRTDTDAARAGYEKLFNVLELAVRCGIIAPDAIWQVSCGEITIHPYRERILELVRGKRTVFYTNCMKYDKDIAKMIHDTPGSAINFSIDAGTAETWKKVKGLDNFDIVKNNLSRYHAQIARPRGIQLKYILLPGLNDTYEDYLSLIGLMKKLDIRHLTLSRNNTGKYRISPEERADLIRAAAELLAVCRENGIATDMSLYSQEEERGVFQLSEEILRGRQA